MAGLFIWRSKRKIELIPVTADFSKDLGAGDSVVSCVVTISVFSGKDSNPAALLYNPVEIFTPRCIQNIVEGVVGVVYLIEFAATTALGNLLKQEVKLAILPDNVPASGKYIPLYFTSWRYPYLYSEHMQVGVVPHSGDMHQVYYNAKPVDSSIINAVPISGFLKSILIQYSYGNAPDKLATTLLPQSGYLKVILITYSWQPDKVGVALVPQSGYLKAILIRYQNYIDHCGIGITPMSGSLS